VPGNTRWEADSPSAGDVDGFRCDILPGLAAVPVRRIAHATGLSVGYASRVRRGLVTPYPMHWATLRMPASANPERPRRDRRPRCRYAERLTRSAAGICQVTRPSTKSFTICS
jgi:hypothetical protein